MKSHKKLSKKERRNVLILAIAIFSVFIWILFGFLDAYNSSESIIKAESAFVAFGLIYAFTLYGGGIICLILTILKKVYLIKFVIIFDIVGAFITFILISLQDSFIQSIIHF